MIRITLDEILAIKGKTKYWLAKETDINYQTLLLLQQNKTTSIRFETLEKICIALDCTPNDIIKIDRDIPIDLETLGFVDHNITVNVVKDDKIIDKRKLNLPEKIVNVAKCKNPRCITSIERDLDQVFILTDKENQVYRCKYCEMSLKRK